VQWRSHVVFRGRYKSPTFKILPTQIVQLTLDDVLEDNSFISLPPEKNKKHLQLVLLRPLTPGHEFCEQRGCVIMSVFVCLSLCSLPGHEVFESKVVATSDYVKFARATLWKKKLFTTDLNQTEAFVPLCLYLNIPPTWSVHVCMLGLYTMMCERFQNYTRNV